MTELLDLVLQAHGGIERGNIRHRSRHLPLQRRTSTPEGTRRHSRTIGSRCDNP